MAMDGVELVCKYLAFQVDAVRMSVARSVSAVSRQMGTGGCVRAVFAFVARSPPRQCVVVRSLDVEPVLHHRRQSVAELADGVVGVVGFDLWSLDFAFKACLSDGY